MSTTDRAATPVRIDPTDIGDVELRAAGAAQRDGLLVTRASTTEAHVEQELAAGRLDGPAE
jgi:hypothetical protein